MAREGGRGMGGALVALVAWIRREQVRERVGGRDGGVVSPWNGGMAAWGHGGGQILPEFGGGDLAVATKDWR